VNRSNRDAGGESLVRTYFGCAVLLLLYAATAILLHGCRTLPKLSAAELRYDAAIAQAGQEKREPRPAPLPPAAPPPLVLFFTSPSCGPCRPAAQLLPEIEAKGWKTETVSFADQPERFAEWGVDAVPTFIALRRGAECGRVTSPYRADVYRMLRGANNVQPKEAAP